MVKFIKELNNMSLSSSYRVYWTGKLPILQAILPKPSVKRVSIPAVLRSEVAVAPVVSSLIGGQVGDYHHRLGKGGGKLGERINGGEGAILRLHPLVKI